ncbi:hypothetical protein Hte_008295 [Hypoxylon texense]
MADSSSDTQRYDPSTWWVAPARNFRTSARLHLQHLLFQNTLGFLLEPRVQDSVSDAEELKLCDLHDELSSKGVSAQLHGFDVNPVNFPAPAYLPSSVTLRKLDVLARPLPEEILGAYDVVHVRAFVSIVVKEDLQPLLSTALALLKPGGWLQWEESRADRYAILEAGGRARGATFAFLADLDRRLAAHGGFEDVRVRSADTRRRDWKAWTEDYLMVWEELAVLFPSRETQPQAPMTREAWVELFANAVGETERGVAVHHGQVVAVVGRKAA